MVKRRLCIVLSPPIAARKGLVTVVALSTTAPDPVMPYHARLSIPFPLPEGWAHDCWVKGDMINAVSFARCDLLFLGKGGDGRRIYQTTPLGPEVMSRVEVCVRAALGMKA